MNKRLLISLSVALLFSVLTVSFVSASMSEDLIQSSSISDDINFKVNKNIYESSSISDEIKVKVIRP